MRHLSIVQLNSCMLNVGQIRLGGRASVPMGLSRRRVYANDLAYTRQEERNVSITVISFVSLVCGDTLRSHTIQVTILLGDESMRLRMVNLRSANIECVFFTSHVDFNEVTWILAACPSNWPDNGESFANC